MGSKIEKSGQKRFTCRSAHCVQNVQLEAQKVFDQLQELSGLKMKRIGEVSNFTEKEEGLVFVDFLLIWRALASMKNGADGDWSSID